MSYRIVVRFTISGDLRFLSHQDSVRLFERAAARAELPLRWSQGFNPRARLSLPLPRPLGIASEDELLLAELEESEQQERLEPGELLTRLAEQMPDGIRLIDAQEAPATPRPHSVRYRIDLPRDRIAGDLAERVKSLLDEPECTVRRQTDAHGNSRPMDIRPYVEQLHWEARTGRLVMTLAVTAGGSARPGEVLGALGLEPADLGHRIVREHVDWQPAAQPGAAAPPPAARKED